MSRSRKRRRGMFGVINVPNRRPIDKELKFISKSGLTSTQTGSVLKTTTFPCTVLGIRWDLSVTQDGGTGDASGAWAIIVVHDGDAANSISFTDGADFYTPEQDVLAFGAWNINSNYTNRGFQGATKTMRKLQQGDQLQWICLGVVTNTSAIRGIIQFFCKT